MSKMGYIDFGDFIEANIRRDIIKETEEQRNAIENGYGYWLDNCGDDIWYCDHCFQKYECGKRLRRGKDGNIHR